MLHSSLVVAIAAVFLGSLALHLTARARVDAVRSKVVATLRADSERWAHVDQVELAPLRDDFDVTAELAGDVASSHVWLRKTTQVLGGGRGLVGRLVNVTREFYGWMRNHLALSHGVTRGVQAPPLTRVCLPISITTRNSKWRKLEDMLLLTSLLPSLVRVRWGFFECCSSYAHSRACVTFSLSDGGAWFSVRRLLGLR